MEGTSGGAPGRTASVTNTFAELSLPPLFSRVQHPRSENRLALWLQPRGARRPTTPTRLAQIDSATTHTQTPPAQSRPTSPRLGLPARALLLWWHIAYVSNLIRRVLHIPMHIIGQHVACDLLRWPRNSNIWRPTMRAADTRAVVMQLPLTTDMCFGPEI